MDSVRVPLTIRIDDERFDIGYAEIEPDGSLATHIPSGISPALMVLVEKAYKRSASFLNGRVEKAVRAQAARYGLQTRFLEDQGLWDDRLRLRAAYRSFRGQLSDTPHLAATVVDAYWSSYSGFSYDLYWPRWQIGVDPS